MNSPLVQILLSTYNGGLYLKEQIESILAQSYKHWELLIRDDASTDNTKELIDAYVQQYPDQIRIITGGKGGDSSNSFMSMLAYSSADYLMFCDQDDSWMPTKIEESLTLVQQLEFSGKAALVYTDMQVVNEDLKELYPSFIKHQKLNPQWVSNKYNVFAQSMAAGCTMLFNRRLLQYLHPIKAPLFQHDHWLLMHAACYGKLGFINTPLVKYRQHEENAVGSHAVDLGYFASKTLALKKVMQRWQYIKSQFKPQISILQIALAKFKINVLRVLSR